MNHEGIQGLGAHDEVAGALPRGAVMADTSATFGVQPSFGRMVADGLQKLNQELKASQADLQGLALGETRNLHKVMVRLEESRIAFQLMLQVRNRVLEAYQEVMRMQV